MLGASRIQREFTAPDERAAKNESYVFLERAASNESFVLQERPVHEESTDRQEVNEVNLQSRLEQFRNDNPYDVDTQAKRLLAGGDKDLLIYTLSLGLAAAKQRQRHVEREFIKNIGEAPPKERLVPGPVTGSVKIIPSKRTQNALIQLIADTWRVNGEQKLGDATGNDLAVAIKREMASSVGHEKNARFYGNLRKKLGKEEIVREQWDEKSIKAEIEKVYGEFRKEEAA